MEADPSQTLTQLKTARCIANTQMQIHKSLTVPFPHELPFKQKMAISGPDQYEKH